MTSQEACERYHIPMELLKKYQGWGLCACVKKQLQAQQYDDTDLERLSLILTLRDVGFETQEIETYMKLLIQGENTQDRRMQMLNEKRSRTLDKIHVCEKQRDRLDYLRHELRRKQNNGKQ